MSKLSLESDRDRHYLEDIAKPIILAKKTLPSWVFKYLKVKILG